MLGCKESKGNEQYLGLPSMWGKSKLQAMRFIVEQLRSKAQGWKEKLLSSAGKEILIKAVLQALPAYAMSIFRLPMSIVNKIEEILRKFWWGSNIDK